MATRITDEPVVDRRKYPKMLVFLDSEGYVAVADKPKGISEEERAKRQKARDKVKQEAKKQRAEERANDKAEREATKKAKAKEVAELRKAISEANADYKEAVKTKDSRIIGKALDALIDAQVAYNKARAE